MSRILRMFPNLKNYRIIDPECDGNYNCVAHAMGDNRKWWWPGSHWPTIKKNYSVSVEDFDALLLKKLSGTITTDLSYEPGYVKLALFCVESGHPTHMARLVESGMWESKLGNKELIEHELFEMNGGDWGNVCKIYKITQVEWKRIKYMECRSWAL